MEIADAYQKIMWFDMSWNMTTHDSLAWITTEIVHDVNEGGLRYSFYLLDDSALTFKCSLITPRNDDDFNYEQISLRANVECTFGQIIRWWGILSRPSEIEFRKRAAVIFYSIRLPNFCVDERVQMMAFMHDIAILEVTPVMHVMSLDLDRQGSPREQMHYE